MHICLQPRMNVEIKTHRKRGKKVCRAVTERISLFVDMNVGRIVGYLVCRTTPTYIWLDFNNVVVVERNLS